VAKKIKSRPFAPPPTGDSINEFASRARSVLWRKDVGKKKPTYDRWKASVDIYQTKEGGGLTYYEAVIKASEEHSILANLLAEYDVEAWKTAFDNAPKEKVVPLIVCEGIEKSYRDNLRWAAEAAGHFLRDKTQVESCPNNTAWYLYVQAIESPKEFMAKVGQIEVKVDVEEERRQNSRNESKRTISEIESYLEELIEEEENGKTLQAEVL